MKNIIFIFLCLLVAGCGGGGGSGGEPSQPSPESDPVSPEIPSPVSPSPQPSSVPTVTPMPTAPENRETITWYRDADEDGYGDVGSTMIGDAAQAPSGFVANSTDCDDNDPNNYPGNQEQADKVDNNCNGEIDESVAPAANDEEPLSSPTPEVTPETEPEPTPEPIVPSLIHQFSFENGELPGELTLINSNGIDWRVGRGDASHGDHYLEWFENSITDDLMIQWTAELEGGTLSFDVSKSCYSIVVQVDDLEYDFQITRDASLYDSPDAQQWLSFTLNLEPGEHTITWKSGFSTCPFGYRLDNIRYSAPQKTTSSYISRINDVLLWSDGRIKLANPDFSQVTPILLPKYLGVSNSFRNYIYGVVITDEGELAVLRHGYPINIAVFNPRRSTWRTITDENWRYGSNPAGYDRSSGVTSKGNVIYQCLREDAGVLTIDLLTQQVSTQFFNQGCYHLLVINQQLLLFSKDDSSAEAPDVVKIYDIESLEFIREFTIPQSKYIVKKGVELVVADWANNILIYDLEGNELQSLSISSIPGDYLYSRRADSIVVDGNGEILFTDGFNDLVVRLDESLSFVSEHHVYGIPEALQLVSNDKDEDDDGMIDYWEELHGLNSNDPGDANMDLDGDGLLNLEEMHHQTAPNLPDSDADTLSDGDEVNLYLSNPLNDDSDGDQLLDGDEVNQHNSNPNKPDTDDDTIGDYDEVNNYQTSPDLVDSDADGMWDNWEILHGLNPHVNDAQEDLDADALSNVEEFNLSLNPNLADTDYDGLNDGDEVKQFFTDPLSPDTDGDLIVDGYEIANGLDAGMVDNFLDKDIDGYSNLWEFLAEALANDAEQIPQTPGSMSKQHNAFQNAFFAIDLDTSAISQLWTFNAENTLNSIVSWQGQMILSTTADFFNGEADLMALDAFDGSQVWRYDATVSELNVLNDRLYAYGKIVCEEQLIDCNSTKGLLSIDLFSAEVELLSDVDYEFSGGMTAADKIYLEGEYSAGSPVIGIDPDSGSQLMETSGYDIDYTYDWWPVALDSGRLIVPTYKSLRVFNAQTGELNFEIFGERCNGPRKISVIDSRFVVVSMLNASPYCINIYDLEKRSIVTQYSGYAQTNITGHGGIAYYIHSDYHASETDGLRAIDLETGEVLWNLPINPDVEQGSPRQLLLTNTHALVLTSNKLLAVSLDSQTIVWEEPIASASKMGISELGVLHILAQNTVTAYAIEGDRDADGMPDAWERRYGFDYLNPADASLDEDADQLSNLEEFVWRSNPLVADTDGDGLDDVQEQLALTNPQLVDTDFDGLTDAQEVNVYLSDPHVQDSDSDGLLDVDEALLHFSDPQLTDTDSDGMDDMWEVSNMTLVNTHSAVMDHDEDGVNNLDEFLLGLNPQDSDSDNDELPDGWEIQHEIDPLDYNGYSDTDGDGLNHRAEFRLSTDPNKADTDDDGMPDGWENQYGLDPLFDDSALDPDEDAISNLDEYLNGTSPIPPITNYPPVVYVRITDPATYGGPYTLEDIHVEVTSSYDIDGDDYSITFTWYVNEQFVAGINGTSLPASYTRRDDVVTVKAVAHDGFAIGEHSDSVTVANSVPTIGEIPDIVLQLEEKFLVELDIDDVDGDPLTVTWEIAESTERDLAVDYVSDTRLRITGVHQGSSYSLKVIVSDDDRMVIQYVDVDVVADDLFKDAVTLEHASMELIGVMLADLDGDNLDDIVFHTADDGLFAQFQMAGGDFSEAHYVTGLNEYHDFYLADLNDDGKSEIITGVSNTIAIHSFIARGVLAEPQIYYSFYSYPFTYAKFADMDNNGFTDIVTYGTNYGEHLEIYYQYADNSFTDGFVNTFYDIKDVNDLVHIMDVDNDAVMELIYEHEDWFKHEWRLDIYEDDSQSSYWSHTTSHLLLSSDDLDDGFHFIDYRKDSDTEFLFFGDCVETGGSCVYLYDDFNHLGEVLSYRQSYYVEHFFAGDINADSYIDILSHSESTSKFYVLLGKADGTFKTTQEFSIPVSTSFGKNKIAFGDLNGDNKDDLIALRGSTFYLLFAK